MPPPAEPKLALERSFHEPSFMRFARLRDILVEENRPTNHGFELKAAGVTSVFACAKEG